jgi:hypothetical protein
MSNSFAAKETYEDIIDLKPLHQEHVKRTDISEAPRRSGELIQKRQGQYYEAS